jgi:hypothetical protein
LDSGETAHNYPDVLPDGDGAVFTIWRGGVANFEIGAVDFRTGTHHTLVKGIYARYASPGYLVYVSATGTLLAAPFDQHSLELTGEPTALAEGIGIRGQGYVDLALSKTGTLLYTGGDASAISSDLVWVARDGTSEVIDSSAFDAPVVSPDGRRVASGANVAGSQNIWVRLMPNGPMSKLTFEGSDDSRPFFSPDGSLLGFYSTQARVASLFTVRADGSAPAESLLARPNSIYEAAWSPDGRGLVYRIHAVPLGDIMAVRSQGDTTPVPLVATGANERAPALSPDSRWLAYVSDESGSDEVYVRPFPDAARGKWQVSLQGGTEPVWAHNGRELFYRNPAGDMVSATVTTQPTFAVGHQAVLFQGAAFLRDDSHREYDVSPDDRRFLMVRPRNTGANANLVMVENWFTELVEKVPS